MYKAMQALVQREVEVFQIEEVTRVRRRRLIFTSAVLVIAIVLRAMYLPPTFNLGGRGLAWGVGLGLALWYLFNSSSVSITFSGFVVGLDMIVGFLTPLSSLAQTFLFPATLLEIFARVWGIERAIFAVPGLFAVACLIWPLIRQGFSAVRKKFWKGLLFRYTICLVTCGLYFRFGFLAAAVADITYSSLYWISKMIRVWAAGDDDEGEESDEEEGD